jgi:hypothetical protein
MRNFINVVDLFDVLELCLLFYFYKKDNAVAEVIATKSVLDK